MLIYYIPYRSSQFDFYTNGWEIETHDQLTVAQRLPWSINCSTEADKALVCESGRVIVLDVGFSTVLIASGYENHGKCIKNIAMSTYTS